MSQEKNGKKNPGRQAVLAIFISVFAVALVVAALFLTAGHWDWTRGWLYIGLSFAGESIRTGYIRRKNPDLLARRGKIGSGTKTWDIFLLGFFSLAYLGILAVSALDKRYGWSEMSYWLWGAGFPLYVFYVAVVTSAMAVNPHFEKTARIQHDQGHHVIDAGPYRIIRHPGYLAIIVGFIIPVPFLLGSWWAFLPAFIAVLLLVIRTALEDRLLRKELEGYEEYAGRVRFRLVPGIW